MTQGLVYPKGRGDISTPPASVSINFEEGKRFEGAECPGVMKNLGNDSCPRFGGIDPDFLESEPLSLQKKSCQRKSLVSRKDGDQRVRKCMESSERSQKNQKGCLPGELCLSCLQKGKNLWLG